MIGLTDEIIADLKRKHANLMQFSIERNSQLIVVRSPDESEFQRALDKMTVESKRPDAVTELGEACIVFPDKETVRIMAKSAPGIYFSAGNKALEMAGISEGHNVKKL